MSHYDFKPRFYNDFQCVGSDCEDSCCTNWSITMDRKTYEFMIYKSALKEQAKTSFVLTPQADHFAEIRLDSERRCVFLDEENWCRVQQVDGWKHLSNTCRLYPRKEMKRGETLSEHTLLLSCPEAVKNILFSPYAMQFQRVELDYPVKTTRDYFRPSWYADVQRWMMRVLQQRHVSFETKMYVMGRSLSVLGHHVGDEQKFHDHLLAVSQKNYQQQVKKEFKRHPSAILLQSYFFMSLLDMLASNSCFELMEKSPRLRTLTETIQSILCGAQRPVEMLKKILQSEPQNYSQFFESYPWIWRNYFLYRAYVEDFPSGSFRQFFYYFLFEFIYFRTVLWILASERELNEDDVTWVVQSFHKSLYGKSFIKILDNIENSCLVNGYPSLQPLRLLKSNAYSSVSRSLKSGSPSR